MVSTRSFTLPPPSSWLNPPVIARQRRQHAPAFLGPWDVARTGVDDAANAGVAQQPDRERERQRPLVMLAFEPGNFQYVGVVA